MNRDGSRMTRKLEEQTKRQVITLIIILGALVIVFLFFGGDILGFFGNLALKFNSNNNTTTQIVSKDFVQAPFLDPLPDATPSANITVSGSTEYKDATAEIDVNNTAYTDIVVDSNGKFEKNVSLSSGDNTIKARVTSNGKSSDFTQDYTVTQTKAAPKLDISFPSDGQQFQKADKQITLTGTTDPNNTVTVNGYRAVVNDDGSFSYYMQLNDGDNQITVDAVDQAGNKTEKQLKVNYKS